MNPYYWTSQLVQLNVRSRLCLLAFACAFSMPIRIIAMENIWNNLIFKCKTREKGLICTQRTQVDAHYYDSPVIRVPARRPRRGGRAAARPAYTDQVKLVPCENLIKRFRSFMNLKVYLLVPLQRVQSLMKTWRAQLQACCSDNEDARSCSTLQEDAWGPYFIGFCKDFEGF